MLDYLGLYMYIFSFPISGTSSQYTALNVPVVDAKLQVHVRNVTCRLVQSKGLNTSLIQETQLHSDARDIVAVAMHIPEANHVYSNEKLHGYIT